MGAADIPGSDANPRRVLSICVQCLNSIFRPKFVTFKLSRHVF